MEQRYIAIIERDGRIIPIINGGEGPDAECMKVWTDYSTARSEADEVPLARAYPAYIINLDDAE